MIRKLNVLKHFLENFRYFLCYSIFVVLCNSIFVVWGKLAVILCTTYRRLEKHILAFPHVNLLRQSCWVLVSKCAVQPSLGRSGKDSISRNKQDGDQTNLPLETTKVTDSKIFFNFLKASKIWQDNKKLKSKIKGEMSSLKVKWYP